MRLNARSSWLGIVSLVAVACAPVTSAQRVETNPPTPGPSTSFELPQVPFGTLPPNATPGSAIGLRQMKGPPFSGNNQEAEDFARDIPDFNSTNGIDNQTPS